MQPKYTYEQLIEKITRARIKLASIPHESHRITCPMEDLESYAPCNCGASARWNPISDALEALKL